MKLHTEIINGDVQGKVLVGNKTVQTFIITPISPEFPFEEFGGETLTLHHTDFCHEYTYSIQDMQEAMYFVTASMIFDNPDDLTKGSLVITQTITHQFHQDIG